VTQDENETMMSIDSHEHTFGGETDNAERGFDGSGNTHTHTKRAKKKFNNWINQDSTRFNKGQ
jgi:hypothetical protein